MKMILIALVLMTSSAFAANGACDSKAARNTCVFYDGPDFFIDALKMGCTGQDGMWAEECPAGAQVCELNQTSFNMNVHLYDLTEEQAQQGCDAMGGVFIGRE